MVLNPTRKQLPDEEVRTLLAPQGRYGSARVAHPFRKRRLAEVAWEPEWDGWFYKAENVRDVMVDTQLADENHRRLTPHVQQLWHEDRRKLMTRVMVQVARNASSIRFGGVADAIIIGSGPHGCCVATTLRELYPKSRIAMIDRGERLGGQFGQYGPRVSYVMNSRVRRANRRIEPFPRTEGNINPLGPYSPVELADVIDTPYPTNVDMADVCRLNAYLSCDEFLLGAEVTAASFNRVKVIWRDREYDFQARRVYDCTGITNQSVFGVTGANYYRPADLYTHWANNDRPGEAFHRKTVAVIGSGDSALTALEALMGNLGGNRFVPTVYWFNQFGVDAPRIKSCLRTRYQNGIVQNLPVQPAAKARIVPIQANANRLYHLADRRWLIASASAPQLAEVDIVIDCTASAAARPFTAQGAIACGPLSRTLPPATINVINQLGLPENIVALWATVPNTVSSVLPF